MHLDVKMRAISLYIGSISGSLLASWIVLHSLHPEDRVSVVQGLCLLSLGFLFFISLFDLCNYFLLNHSRGQRLVKKYQLNLYEVADISNKIVSAVQAVLSCLAGGIVCTYSCSRNLLKTSHFMSDAYAWFGASYFIYDIYSMYVVHCFSVKTLNRLKISHGGVCTGQERVLKIKDFITNEPIMIMHHIFIGIYGFLVIVHLRKNFGDCTFGFLFLMELSTPFVSARSILSRLKLKYHRIYLINGILMIIVFFICRILVWIYLIYKFSHFIQVPFWQGPFYLPTICQISSAILILPQFYWMILMVKGAIKLATD